MDEQLYAISVDWFQVSCKRDPKQILGEGMYVYGTATTDDGRELCYKLASPKEFNAIFNTCLSVQYHGFTLATIYLEPRPTTIPASMCLVKMANAVLYSSRWCWYLCDILAALKWEFRAISRVDLCCDFNRFAQGMTPREFIQRYMASGPYDPTKVSYYRVHGNKYTIIGEKKLVPKDVSGLSEDCLRHDFEYLRFGKRSSGVNVYLYNKTAELNASGKKAYIRDLWQRVGLTDTTDEPVFRLEISINSSGCNVKAKVDDETLNERRTADGMYHQVFDRWHVRSLSLDDFGTQQLVEGAFWSYASHYFSFRIVGSQRSPQHWTPLILFTPRFVTSFKPCRLSTPLDSGVSERNAANHIEKLLYSAADLSVVELVSLKNAADILRRLSHLKQTSYQPEQLEKAVTGLTAGWSWEELNRRKVIPAPAIERLKDVVENHATRELMFYRRDPFVSQSMDECDAAWELVREEAGVCQ